MLTRCAVFCPSLSHPRAAFAHCFHRFCKALMCDNELVDSCEAATSCAASVVQYGGGLKKCMPHAGGCVMSMSGTVGCAPLASVCPISADAGATMCTEREKQTYCTVAGELLSAHCDTHVGLGERCRVVRTVPNHQHRLPGLREIALCKSSHFASRRSHGG